MEFALPTMYAFGLLLFRTTGLFVTAPILSSRSVPMQVRLSLAVGVALIVFTGAGSPQAELPDGFLKLGMSVALETTYGLVAGLCSRLILEAAVAAGQTAGLSMGLGFGAFIDPNSGADSNALGQLFSLLAVAFAISMGIHREALAWLAASAKAVPPGAAIDLASLGHQVVRHALMSITVAVRMAYPILVAVTFGHLGLAIAGRTAPNFNLSSVGFSVAILAGGGALFLVTPAAAQFAAQVSVSAFTGR